MELFWKTTSVILLTVIFAVTIGKTEKDFSLVLSITACCIVLKVATQYLAEVIAFFWKWNSEFHSQNSFVNIILKISGVALLSELTALISSDAGNSSLAKAMEILGNAVILFLSLPIFQTFVTIIQDLLGRI